jgi:phosphatidylglycerophosphate synthase
VTTTLQPRASERTATDGIAAAERLRALNYPLSRWYLRPLAGALAQRLSTTPVTPCQLTCGGLLLAGGAAVVLIVRPDHAWLAALLTLGWWFCDRTDGQLARLRRTASPLGAWLDANVDELADLGLHAALACAATHAGSAWAWPCFIGFVAGKYLLMYGMFVEEGQQAGQANCDQTQATSHTRTESRRVWRRLYHLPANADVRVHLLLLAMVSGLAVVELALVAAYYNFRWIVRYFLMARRLGGAT